MATSATSRRSAAVLVLFSIASRCAAEGVGTRAPKTTPAPAVLKPMIKGISYGLSPSQSELPKNDDFFCDEAAPQWEHVHGRGDLRIIKALGANSVRLYGNDPRLNHGKFLDAAQKLGLSVMPGNSDWPFMQAPDNCKSTSEYDCRNQVQTAYAMNLQNGFLKGGKYHPAISHVIAINEPDMKLPDVSQPKLFCKAVISAIDGMLSAESEANVTEGLPNVTVTFSWSICSTCEKFSDKPGLGQMWALRDAFLNPEKYGYTQVNDLAEFYRTRFVYSFNTANPSFEIRPLFLDDYEREFPETPIFVAEYHWNNRKGDQQADLQNITKIVQESPLLLGISFFEYQLRTDLGGHVDFGMLRFGNQQVSKMDYFGSTYDIRCLEPVLDGNGRSLPEQVALAYGGMPSVFAAQSCIVGKDIRLPTTTTARPKTSTTTATTVTTTVELTTTTYTTTKSRRLRHTRTTTEAPEESAATRTFAARALVASLAAATLAFAL